MRRPALLYYAGTILFALTFNLATGLLFSLCSRERICADGTFASPAFPLVAGFALLLVAPASLYLYAVHPAWWWLYWIDPTAVPALAGLPVVTVNVAFVLGAYYFGGRLLRAGKPRAVVYSVTGLAVLLLVLFVALRHRLFAYGSHSEFVAGLSRDLMEVKLGYVLVALSLGLLAGVGFVALELLRDSRRVRGR